jgi:phosphonate transport system substrate-binding protein
MFAKRFLLLSALILFIGCSSNNSRNTSLKELNVGVVSYGASDGSLERYSELKEYLGRELNSFVELEPTYNEIKALNQIERKNWEVVFAPPGLAAIAISQAKYKPIFPLEGGLKARSVIVTRENSSITNISQLGGKTVAFGQAGSSTGYYLPLYNLYGLTLAEARLKATPKAILESVANKEVEAGAMSMAEFNQHRSQFSGIRFRILYTDSHEVPSGAVLVSPNLDPTEQKKIQQALSDVSPAIASSAGYITNAPVPNYQYLIEVVDRVGPIAERIKEKPAPLYEQKRSP